MTSTTSPTDFDYIGTGGLSIQCIREKVLGLSREQVSVLKSKSPFFRGCLECGMKESSDRIVLKQDWTIEVVRHLVEACMTGYTLVPSLDMYCDVTAAADQALMDLFLCDMICYDLPSPLPQRENHFLELVSAPMILNFSGDIHPELWYALLEKEVLLLPKHHSILLKMPVVGTGYRDPEHPEDSIFDSHDPRVKVPVHTNLDEVGTILCIRDVINEMHQVDVDVSGSETFYLSHIRWSCWEISVSVGSTDPADIRSFRSWRTSSPLSVSSSVLEELLRNATPHHTRRARKGVKCCRFCSRISLAVIHPTRQTLHRLLHATANQNRALLMDPHKNVYGCEGSVTTLVEVLAGLNSKEVITSKKKKNVELRRGIEGRNEGRNEGIAGFSPWNLSTQSKDRLRALQRKGKKRGYRIAVDYS